MNLQFLNLQFLNLQFLDLQFLVLDPIDRGNDNNPLPLSSELSTVVDGNASTLLASGRSTNASSLGADGQVHLDVLAVLLLTTLVSAIVLRSMNRK